ncbi:hypothetical protein Ahy_A03g012984 [Arachis hypogaea]|uniref:Uncharacterized protein n=1 Tax=Arachis hypogaea TaxID=3818 RepID=A0A445DUS5_ARAHY|nr:hypothetical protein Ahy_A03g012984 [Arachis hypogaea]
MSEEKKVIVRDLGFGGLMHIPPLRVHHQILKELANSFKLGENRLETGYGLFKVRPRTIGAALGINASDYNLKRKKAIDGYLFALMIVRFHLSKNKDKKWGERPLEPWIANWTREQLVERMRAEMEEHMASSSSSSEAETTYSEVHSTSESEIEEDIEDSTRKQPTRKGKKTQSKKKKVIVEDSSPEQAQSYHGSEIGTEKLDEFLREKNEKSAALGEKEADLRSTEAHYVSSEIVPIQVCLTLSQTTTVPEIE